MPTEQKIPMDAWRTPERPWGDDPWSVLPPYDGRPVEDYYEEDDRG